MLVLFLKQLMDVTTNNGGSSNNNNVGIISKFDLFWLFYFTSFPGFWRAKLKGKIQIFFIVKEVT